jgi:hypothetical protein
VERCDEQGCKKNLFGKGENLYGKCCRLVLYIVGYQLNLVCSTQGLDIFEVFDDSPFEDRISFKVFYEAPWKDQTCSKCLMMHEYFYVL